MAPACSSISLFPSAQTKNTRDGPTAAFPKDSILSRMGKPRIQPTISFVISFIPAWAGKLDAAHRQLGGDGPIPTHAGKTHSHSLPPITTLAHPRSRGENYERKTGEPITSGSSPLTRGKRKHRVEHRLHGGLIPAHAGKTQDQPRRTPQTSAHPRSRGENGPGDRACLTSSGSSPLTRGKRLADLRDGLNLRLIPAHAGKTSSRCSRKACIPAHPRSRGENHRLAAGIEDAGGSSPPHAGKTHDTHVTPPARRAHPRSRGENHRCVHLRTVASGSSPLTRGKPRANASMSARVGLIPAHAGKTGRRRGRSQQLSAHPRSRGENAGTASRRESRAGSSPLTRGKQGGYRVNGRGLRLIPAHAGKTCATSTGNSHAPAHPRSRGENWLVRSTA